MYNQRHALNIESIQHTVHGLKIANEKKNDIGMSDKDLMTFIEHF